MSAPYIGLTRALTLLTHQGSPENVVTGTGGYEAQARECNSSLCVIIFVLGDIDPPSCDHIDVLPILLSILVSTLLSITVLC